MLAAYLNMNNTSNNQQYAYTMGNYQNISRKINMNNISNRSPKYAGNNPLQIQNQKFMNMNGNLGPQNSNTQGNNFSNNYNNMKFVMGNNPMYNFPKSIDN